MKASIKELRKYLGNMSLRGVVEILENLGSSQDPIMYMGQETTPEELSYKMNERMPAIDMRICFYGKKRNGEFGWRRCSTFAQMILDRMKKE